MMLANGYGSGDGYVDGYVYGYGDGSGYVYGYGDGSGYGYGHGVVNGNGYGYGDGDEQPTTTRLLMPNTDIKFYLCQLHTLGG